MSYLDLQFSVDEARLIELAWNNGVLNWSSPDLLPVRMKVRNHHRLIQHDKCCYCRKSFLQGHPLEVDVEHILPRVKYQALAVALVNLTIACKRCNMQVKKERNDFIVGPLEFYDDCDVSDSSRYKIIHPNLDVYSEHINAIFVDVDNIVLRRYMILGGSSKGQATVQYFLLRHLEEDTLDEIQGLGESTGVERAGGIRALLGL
ncbi:HNH endonuclease [Stenotrophomonas sp. RG-453]|uniref:HNH endonuclease n=1 Tax=Stenotrophomonas sp. RG-453 TaxID=2957502 RepID=UPI0029CA8CAE|nr:HNH endonuclease [Stenotrophomonas sp. RG-453]MDX5516512.1 HNH endonuclease [Stenotrophomonas sp. RG-453]